jgi:hypothetical protein
VTMASLESSEELRERNDELLDETSAYMIFSPM